jgi:hypothetical protein
MRQITRTYLFSLTQKLADLDHGLDAAFFQGTDSRSNLGWARILVGFWNLSVSLNREAAGQPDGVASGFVEKPAIDFALISAGLRAIQRLPHRPSGRGVSLWDRKRRLTKATRANVLPTLR